MFRPDIDSVGSVVQKFGQNAAVTTGQDDIWAFGGSYPFQTVADELRIKVGGDAADVFAGGGAREVTIEGLDANGREISESLPTLGALESIPTTQQFLRVNRAYVSAAGTYATAWNTGNIDIETQAGTTLARINAAEGQTQMAVYSVPQGKEAHLTRITARVSAAGVILLKARENFTTVVAPVSATRVLSTWDATAFLPNPVDVHYDAFINFPELTDIWFAGDAASGTIGVTVQFDIALV